MENKTDLDAIKKKSKMLFDMVSIEDASDLLEMDGLFVSHPFTNAGFSFNGKRILKLLESEDDFNEFRNIVFREIDKANNLFKIMLLVNKPYLFFWFKLIRMYLSEEDYGNLLSDIWVTSENPNGDINVSLKEAVEYFKVANKKYLMEEDEYKYFKSLPDEMTVFRGVSKGRNVNGLSYTLNKDKAIWFQNRFSDENNPGLLIEKKIKKEDILCYFNRRSEDEIVLNVFG